jgi:hypothetical protein
MPTAAAPRGKTVTLLMKDESNFGSPPSGDWTQTFVYSWCKGGARPLERDPLLGTARQNNRDATQAAPGLPTFDGAGVSVPLDLAHFGWWLKGGFGAPVTTNVDDDYTHVFTSGKEAIPYRSAELKLAASWFRQDVGLIVGGFDFDLGRKAGFDRVGVKLMGQKTNKLTSTGGGTPSAPWARVPVPATLPIVKINGTAVGRASSVKASYDNKAAEQNFVGNEYVSGFDLDDDATWNGTFGVRLLDSTYRDLAAAGDAFSLELLWQISSVLSLSILSPATRLALAGEPITGPGGIQAEYQFEAEQDDTNPMVTATLKNPITSYP